MNYPFILKFSSITNLSDARYAAGMWADFIGFNFDPNSPLYIDPNQAKSIIGWINGPSVVGEFGSQPLEWISDFAKQLQFNVIQIPSNYSDLSIFDKGFKTIVRVASLEDSNCIEKADVLLTNDIVIYEELKARYKQPCILEIKSFEEDANVLDGISIVGETELVPGTRNQSAWTDYLEQFESN